MSSVENIEELSGAVRLIDKESQRCIGVLLIGSDIFELKIVILGVTDRQEQPPSPANETETSAIREASRGDELSMGAYF